MIHSQLEGAVRCSRPLHAGAKSHWGGFSRSSFGFPSMSAHPGLLSDPPPPVQLPHEPPNPTDSPPLTHPGRLTWHSFLSARWFMSLYFQAKYQLRFLWGLTAAALGFHSSILTGGGADRGTRVRRRRWAPHAGPWGLPAGTGWAQAESQTPSPAQTEPGSPPHPNKPTHTLINHLYVEQGEPPSPMGS